jgi:hypothetical protein
MCRPSLDHTEGDLSRQQWVVEGRPRGKIATRKDWAHALVLPEWTEWILEKKKKKKKKKKE